MLLNESDFQDVVEEIKPRIETTIPTDKAKESLVLVDIDSMPRSKIGPLEFVLQELAASLTSLNSSLTVPSNFEVQVGIIEENSAAGYIEVMFRLQMIGAGSLNVPHAIVRRSQETYEILLPAEQSDERGT